MEWVSVKTRLPEETEIVIVDGGCAYYRKGEWWTVMEYPVRPIQWNVTHWMPLPQPPKGE